MKLDQVNDGNYYNISTEYEVSPEDLERVEKQPIFSESKKFFKVMLRKEVKGDYFNKMLGKINHDKSKSQQDKYKDKGHFIASAFKKFLIPLKDLKEQKVNNFFGKNNGFNVSLQDSKANRNSIKYRGQLFYEQKILDYFNKQDEKIYFEIEEIFEENKVLGRRIYIHRFMKNPEIKDIHVFIPEERN
ncbi:hypothetical protein [Vaginisenegalia massiliensis]|uniref:hypothetical protein n=1 Tax=Vaginisenegalia massiliensis TaxID=2058294 RepID=UPI000F522654|nr:hypothetical protein [Vaginisenegalia massiliensis]